MQANARGYQAIGEARLWQAVLLNEIRAALGKVSGATNKEDREHATEISRKWPCNGTAMLEVAELAGVNGRAIQKWALRQRELGCTDAPVRERRAVVYNEIAGLTGEIARVNAWDNAFPIANTQGTKKRPVLDLRASGTRTFAPFSRWLSADTL